MNSHAQSLGSEPAAEEWRPVPGYPAYEVSNQGRVRRCRGARGWAAGHVLRPAAGRGGHLYVILADGNGKTRKHYVHRLVAIAFVGPPPFEDAFVLHQDDDAADNRPENLYCGTHQDNVLDAKLNRELRDAPRRHGGQPGEANGSLS